MPAVVVEGLTVRYGALIAVDDVSFVAEPGTVTAVLGPNGAGKTSTIEVCEGYRSPTAGVVRVLGLDPRVEQRRLSERMGVMLQNGGVYPSSRVLDTVRHYCRLYARGADPQVLLRQVGLEQRAGSTWRRLSGGERQRLSLALALAARPEVAFLDEPTAGVDIDGRDAIRAIVRGLAAEGCAVVLATHELDEAERVADHVIVFDGGHVIADGTLADIRRGNGEIRFRSDRSLDVRALAAETGLIAARVSDDEYVIDAPPLPRVMATLTSWLADRGHDLTDLRAGAQRLEDVFRNLTAERAAERASLPVAHDEQPSTGRRRRGTRRGRRTGGGGR